MPDDTRDDAAATVAAALAGTGLLRLGVAARIDLPSVPGAALYCATSGSSSGRPQVVALSAATLGHAVAATDECLGGPGAWLLSLPADHIAGFMVRARAHLAGLPLIDQQAPGVPEPFTAAGFARGVERLLAAAPGATRRYGSLVPTQLRRILEDPAASAAAAALDAILLGGAAASAPLLARAREGGLRIVTTYGMTETAGGCVYDGRALRGTGVALEADGRISLSGEQIALGYVTQRGLVPFAGRVRTNDRGRWTRVAADRADGRAGGREADDDGPRLEVLGRLDDVVISGGVNVDAREVERVAAQVPGVRDVVVVGSADPEWGQAVCLALVTEVGWEGGDVVDRVRAAIRARLGPAHVPKRVRRLDSLPLRGPGKIDRRAIAESFARTPRED